MHLSDQITILMLLETNILLFYLFLRGFVALVDRFGVHSAIEAFCSQHLIKFFLPFSVDVHLSRAVKLSNSNGRFLSMLSGVERRVVKVIGIFLAIMRDSFRILFSGGDSLDLALVSNVVIR